VPERLDVGVDPSDLLAEHGIVPRGSGPVRALGRERDEVADLGAHHDDVLRERSASFESQCHVRDAPAVVLLADPVRDRDPNLVEEDLAEVAVTIDGPDRPNLDAGR
jgi:hypothetical protein